MNQHTTPTPAASGPSAPAAAPYTPLPEAVALARLLAADTSPDGMAAVLSGFIRVRDKEREAIECQLIDARAALAHALAFIEHSHPHFDDPIAKVDSFTNAVDDGPEMECNLKMMRDALKGAK